MVFFQVVGTIFMCTNTPSQLTSPPPPLSTFAKFIFWVLHPSQEPAPLRSWDSEKRFVLVLPESNTALEK